MGERGSAYHQMTTRRTKEPVLALVLYAKRNVRDMAERAFQSLAQQTRKPDKLIVIDDASEAGFEDVKERVLDLRLDRCHVQVLRNERTPGLCGAMNTAILKLMEYADEENCHVSFMREEDELRKDHFVQIAKSAKSGAKHVILSDVGIEGLKDSISMPLSSTPHGYIGKIYGLDLDLASCLMGAFSVRLDVLMEAGMFNEALRGMQVHELLLRISELPGRVWAATGQKTLFAPPSGHKKHLRSDGVIFDRSRELTPGVILDMRRGSRTFCLLARNRLDPRAQKALHRSICKRIKKRNPGARPWWWGVEYDLKPAKPRKLEMGILDSGSLAALRSAKITVGIISRGNQDEESSGLPTLLRDLEWLSGHLGHLRVCILDNAAKGHPAKPWFAQLTRKTRKFEVEVFKAGLGSADATAKDYHASIATARRLVQDHVANRIRKSGAKRQTLAWFLDEDLSLVNRAMCWDDDECRMWFLGQLSALLKDLGATRASRLAMTLGQVTEAPPIPGTMTFRLQLLDATTSLRRLRSAKLDEKYNYRDFQRVLEKWFSPGREVRDYYYDVSSRDLLHLEFPFDYFPWDNGQFGKLKMTNGEVLKKIVEELPKLAKGKQVFRPIFADRHFAVDPAEMREDGFPAKSHRAKISHSPSVLRGGNTLLPFGASADQYPTVTLKGLKYGKNPITPRRADMVSAVICRYLHAQEVTACALPVRQRREDEGNKRPKELLNPGKYVPDTEGFAIYSALKAVLDERQLARLDTKKGREAREECDFTESDINRFLQSVDDFRKLRTRAIIASFYRIRGLAGILVRELELSDKLMRKRDEKVKLGKALRFARQLKLALRPGFDRHADGPHEGQKILSTPNRHVKYPKDDVKRFLRGLKKYAPARLPR
jgi:hypothetical protein